MAPRRPSPALISQSRLPRGWRTHVVQATAIVLAGIAPVALAQSLPPAAPADDQVVARRSFHVSAGPLEEALANFAAAAGISITMPSSLTQGKRSVGLEGSYTVPEGLFRLLSGTGLETSGGESGVYMLRLAPAAAAQIPAGAAPAQLAPIVVTGAARGNDASASGYVADRSSAGTKTGTALIETPQSITVITQQQMQAQQVQSVQQALRYAPGMYSEPRAAVSRVQWMAARGFQPVDQYLDGLKLIQGDNARPQIDPYFLDSIEFVRGPASVLFGQNQPGGILNLVSKRPTRDPLHEIQLQTGSYGRVQGAFDLGGPVDDDGHFLYRLTGLARDADTQVDHIKEQRYAIAPAFTWRPDDDTSLTILGNFRRDPDAGYYNFLPAQGTLLPNPNGHLPTSFFGGDVNFNRSKVDQNTIGYLFEHRFDSTWRFRQNTRFINTTIDERNVFASGLQSDLRTLNRYAFAAREKINQYAVDNQLQARLSTGVLAHTVLVGVDYQHSDWRYQTWQGPAPSLDIFAPDYDMAIAFPPQLRNQRQKTGQLGFYAQDEIRFDRLRVVVSGRQDHFGSDTTNYEGASPAGQKQHAFTWRTGLVYIFDNGIAPYASYATSFSPVAGADFSGAPYVPSTAKQSELGVKYQPPGHDSFVTASLFDLTQQNVLTVDPAHPTFGIQTGEVRSRGLELSAVSRLTDNIDVTASYAYTDSVNTKSTTAQGLAPAIMPRHTASVWGDYTVHEGALAGFGVGLGVRYVGPTYANAANTLKAPPFTLIDAAVHYDLGTANPNLKGINLQVNVANLFDKEYVSSCPAAPSTCFYGLRRTVLATLSYKW